MLERSPNRKKNKKHRGNHDQLWTTSIRSTFQFVCVFFVSFSYKRILLFCGVRWDVANCGRLHALYVGLFVSTSVKNPSNNTFERVPPLQLCVCVWMCSERVSAIQPRTCSGCCCCRYYHTIFFRSLQRRQFDSIIVIFFLRLCRSLGSCGLRQSSLVLTACPVSLQLYHTRLSTGTVNVDICEEWWQITRMHNA